MSDTKELEELTDEEIDFISKHAKCPDCKKGNLLKGPTAGASMNVKCSNKDCDTELNLAFAGNSIMYGERI